MRELRIDEWVYRPGLPSNVPAPQSNRFDVVDTQIAAWESGAKAATLQVEGWVSQEWDHFLTHITPPMAPDRLADLDANFHFAGANGELQRSWYLLVIANEWEPGYPQLEEFLRTVGRRWLIRPLYAKLAEAERGREFAQRVYREARPGYHALTVNTIDAILDRPNAGE
jgi:hypothetical protein